MLAGVICDLKISFTVAMCHCHTLYYLHETLPSGIIDLQMPFTAAVRPYVPREIGHLQISFTPVMFQYHTLYYLYVKKPSEIGNLHILFTAVICHYNSLYYYMYIKRYLEKYQCVTIRPYTTYMQCWRW